MFAHTTLEMNAVTVNPVTPIPRTLASAPNSYPARGDPRRHSERSDQAAEYNSRAKAGAQRA